MTPDLSRDVHCVLGLPIDVIDLAGAEQRIRAAAAQRTPCFLSTPNVNFLISCRSDEAFRDSVLHSDLSVADGMPLVWAARLMGIPLPERVAGANLFEALRYGAGAPLLVYFFGGTDGAAEAAWQRLRLQGEGLVCVGYAAPGFGSVEDMSRDDIIEGINAAHADLLVVSIGARKGQAWIERNRARLNVPVISYLGAVVNFAAGNVKRAPAWMQRTGLEWLWRIKEEPALWRRYFADGAALLELLLTRVLPYALYVRWRRPRGGEARAEAREEERVCVIRLAGAWTRSNLLGLRRRFHDALAAGKDLSVEMAGVTHIDSAFVGLLALAHAYQKQHGRKLTLCGLRKEARRVIEYCCAEFLCPSDERPAFSDDAARAAAH